MAPSALQEATLVAHLEEEGLAERAPGTGGDPGVQAEARPGLGQRWEYGAGERPQKYRHTP